MKKISVESFFQQAKERLHLTAVAEEGMSDRFIVGVDINRMGCRCSVRPKSNTWEPSRLPGAGKSFRNCFLSVCHASW
jgi:hypothetical protein